MYNTTLVTGFVDISKYGNGDRRKDPSWYNSYAKRFIFKLPIPMYIFVEKDNYDFVCNARKEYGFEEITEITIIEFKNLYCYEQFEKLKRSLDKFNKLKKNKYQLTCNNASYPVVINSKHEFLFRAMIDNKFKSNYFMWIDYGILSRNYLLEDSDFILQIAENPKPNVCIGLINDSSYTFENLMIGYKYLTIGTMFTLEYNRNSFKFLHKWRYYYDRACDEGLYPYEEPIFYHLYKEYPDMFSTYWGNYNTCIFKYHYNFAHEETQDSRLLTLEKISKLT